MNWNDNMTIILMMVAASVLAILFLVVRIFFGPRSVKGGILAMFAKAVASLGFIMIGILAISEGVTNIQAAVYILFGLVMGLVGDIVLDLKVVYDGKEEEGIYLTGGMASFAIGHILYFVAILAFLEVFAMELGGLIGICVGIAVALTAAIMLVGKFIFKFNFGKFLIHSIVYAFMLTFMSVFSIALWIKLGNIMMPFAIGMILFLLSDVVLTQMYFGGQKKNNLLCIINHVLYYAAQISIASFIVLL